LPKLQWLYARPPPEVIEINVPELAVDSRDSSPTPGRLNPEEREERVERPKKIALSWLSQQA
jgi:hypothetical protein